MRRSDTDANLDDLNDGIMNDTSGFDRSRAYSDISEEGNNRNGSEASDAEFLVNFDDGVELTDVSNNYREMLGSLNEFKEQKHTLKSLNIGDESEKINLQLIKM